jgi:hypothetical protein
MKRKLASPTRLDFGALSSPGFYASASISAGAST